MRFFNITGSCDPARHYMIPAERRLPECEALIAKGAYFVVHAPRQTGKTTAMKALGRRLTAEGRYAALRFSCQNAQVFSDDVGAAEEAVWSAVEPRRPRRTALPAALPAPARRRAAPRPSSPAGPRSARARSSSSSTRSTRSEAPASGRS